MTQNQRARRQRIMDVTLALLSERGVGDVSTRTIARESGVAEKTIFNIFGTKHRLIAAATFSRSEQTFADARTESRAPGWPFLLSLVGRIAMVTLERPEIARALAPLLLDRDHGARLDALYVDHVSPALREMIVQGELLAATPVDELVRRIRIGIITCVVAWAGREIADAEIAIFMRASLAGFLLPHATPAFIPALVEALRRPA